MSFRKLKPKTSPRKRKPLQTVAIREKVKAEDADYFLQPCNEDMSLDEIEEAIRR